MEITTKIRINLSSLELEIQGSEAFVNSYSADINGMLERLTANLKGGTPSAQIPLTKNVTTETGLVRPTGLPGTFGEYYHFLKRSSNDNDKILVAGFFAQSNNEDNAFETGDATKLLLEQGVKVANASTSINRNIKSKFLIRLTKKKFRVSSPQGMDHIKELFSEE